MTPTILYPRRNQDQLVCLRYTSQIVYTVGTGHSGEIEQVAVFVAGCVRQADTVNVSFCLKHTLLNIRTANCVVTLLSALLTH